MSRDLNTLQPELLEKANMFLQECEQQGLNVLIYFTLRSNITQAKLYRWGRSLRNIKHRAEVLEKRWNRPDLKRNLLVVGPQYGEKIVTHAAPGQSLHNYGYAFDAAPLVAGRINWNLQDKSNKKLWLKMGTIGQQCNLVWGGIWRGTRKDYPHFQQPNVRWQILIRSRVMPVT